MTTKMILATLSNYKDQFLKFFENRRWDKELNAILASVPERKRHLYKSVLSNQHTYNQLHGESDKCSPFASTKLQKLLMSITKRVLDKLTIAEIVGVQSLTGPAGLLYRMDYLKNDADHPTSPNTIRLEIVKHAVEARTRKLQARWTLEAQQDLLAMHALDIEQELAEAMSSEIACEITTEVLHDLYRLSAENTDTITFTGMKYVSDKVNKLSVYVNKAANEIAMNTRRGPANFLVCNPIMASTLATVKSFVPAEKSKDVPEMCYSTLKLEGVLNGSIKVYSSLCMPGNDEGTIIMGYVGGSSAVDTGYIYAPYVMLMTSGVMVEPVNFTPFLGMMTRYGKHVDDKSKNYYHVLKVANLLDIPKELEDVVADQEETSDGKGN